MKTCGGAILTEGHLTLSASAAAAAFAAASALAAASPAKAGVASALASASAVASADASAAASAESASRYRSLQTQHPTASRPKQLASSRSALAHLEPSEMHASSRPSPPSARLKLSLSFLATSARFKLVEACRRSPQESGSRIQPRYGNYKSFPLHVPLKVKVCVCSLYLHFIFKIADRRI